MVDAGHGGEDYGAIGKNNSREKDVNLAIAKKLVATINQNPDLTAVLTRSGDYYICLLYTSPSPRDRSLSRMPSSA